LKTRIPRFQVPESRHPSPEIQEFVFPKQCLH
jgi:hypothetical protein